MSTAAPAGNRKVDPPAHACRTGPAPGCSGDGGYPRRPTAADRRRLGRAAI